ncbi:MAG: 4-hydroxythreonine-4-phosphate dehydrogenase PdxA [Desulfosoma sp.]
MGGRTESYRPIVAVTMGDPSGVGPEVIVKALQHPWVQERCLPVIIGDVTALQRAMDLVRAELPFKVIREVGHITQDKQPEDVYILCRTPLSIRDIPYGNPSAAACRETIGFIRTAVHLALNGVVDAVVTGPIHKDVLQRQGFSFPGHTEFLQHLTGASHVVMMLAGPKLKVALATIHCALRDVPKRITQENLFHTLEVLTSSLKRDFGIACPKVAVSGLNPHAGEAGRFGREELDVIAPAVNQFRHSHPSCDVSGPYPPDTVFFRAFQGEFDAVLALYHDQGLIPLKLVHFYEATNVTLGLPIVRTSVDHGTGYDIAGKGIAHCGSLLYAMQTAVTMVRHRKS